MLGPKIPETDPEKATVLMGDYNMFDILYFTVYKKHSTYKKKKVYLCLKKFKHLTEQMSCVFETL